MPCSPPSRRRPLALGLAALLLAPGCAYLRARPREAVANAELEELSGLTRSLATDRWLWAHNDSGDRPRLFRVGLDGSDGGEVAVPGALAVDWEDIAAFRWQGQAALLIGDIGDNQGRREAVTLYALRDPGAVGQAAPVLWRLDLRYPGGPRDAEGLAVDPLHGDILILSKRQRPPHLFRVPMPSAPPAPGTAVEAEDLGPVLHLPAPTALDLADDPRFGSLRDWPTAFDISPDGRFAVVTTYKDAYLYRREPGESWSETFARAPEALGLPQWRQTEAGTITADGKQFCAASEQRAGFACLPLASPAP
jgi:hypothetical protein